MNGFKLLCVSAILMASFVGFSSSEEKNCKTLIAEMTKRQLTGIAACSKSMTFKNGKDKAAKMNCVLKCVMVKEGLLAAPGYASSEAFDAFAAKEMVGISQELIDRALPIFKNCFDTHGPGLDPSEKDEFCKTYDPFLKCLMGSLGSLCPK